MGELYRLHFSNGLCYVGASIYGARTRYQDHKCAVDDWQRLPIYRAWKKYGDPRLEVLAVVEDDELWAAEIRAIKIYNTLVPNGYNVSVGGTAPMLGRSHSEEVRQKISVANKGTPPAASTRTAVAEANKRRAGSKHGGGPKISQANLNSWSDPEVRARRIAGMMRRHKEKSLLRQGN